MYCTDSTVKGKSRGVNSDKNTPGTPVHERLLVSFEFGLYVLQTRVCLG